MGLEITANRSNPEQPGRCASTVEEQSEGGADTRSDDTAAPVDRVDDSDTLLRVRRGVTNRRPNIIPCATELAC